MGLSSNLVNTKFDGKSLKDVSQLLNRTETENSRIQIETIEPLRKKIAEFSQSRGSKMASIDRNINSLREKVTTSKTSIELKEQILVTLNNKILQATNDMKVTSYNYTNIVNAAYHGLFKIPANTKDSLESTTTAATDRGSKTPPVSMHQETLMNKQRIVCVDTTGILLDVVDLPYLQSVRDACMTDLASVRVRLDTANKALVNLQNDLIPASVPGPGVTLGASQVLNSTNSAGMVTPVCAVHNAVECPTCGQTLSLSARAEREREVVSAAVSLLSERKAVEVRSADLNKRIEQGQSARLAYQKWNDYNDRSRDVSDELLQAGKMITKMKEDDKVYYSELHRLLLEKKGVEDSDSVIENQHSAALEASLEKLKNSTLLEKKLRMDVDEVCFYPLH